MSKIPLVIILHDVRSMHNVGSIFRTADALGVEKLFLCGLTGRPPHREIQKTALGATETVPWQWLPDTIAAVEILKKDHYHILALEQRPNALPLENFRASGKTAIVLGNEIEGVSEKIIEACRETLFIEQYGSKKSMNVAVAGGIACWWLSRELRKVV